MNESNSIYSSKWFTVMKIFHDDSSSVVIMTHEEVVVFCGIPMSGMHPRARAQSCIFEQTCTFLLKIGLI